uniref:Homing endonuclease n=1 Tax=Siphoviridae sp. ctSdk10 TaxID=2826345 RepID=A0A8S5MJY4_9CAUD|nr:MAG TPA: homing endonuclease [Siphoviridae sp. ctSdk10]
MAIWLTPVLRTWILFRTRSTGRPGMMSTTLGWMSSSKRPGPSSTTTSSAHAQSRRRIERFALATEQWKTIPGLNDKYEVSDLGRVRNKNTGRFLTPRYKDGCYMYRMEKPSAHGRERKVYSAAVLVWSLFVDKIPDGYWVQYKDGNRRNLAVSNLYLKSNSEFRKDEYEEGRSGFLQVKSEFDEWIFGDCIERRTW